MQKEFIVLKEWWRAVIRCIGGFCTLYTFVLYVDWSLKASSSASSFWLFYCVDPPWCFAFWFDHIWSKIMCWSMCTFVSSWEISRTVPLTCFTLDTRMFKDPRKGSVDLCLHGKSPELFLLFASHLTRVCLRTQGRAVLISCISETSFNIYKFWMYRRPALCSSTLRFLLVTTARSQRVWLSLQSGAPPIFK